MGNKVGGIPSASYSGSQTIAWWRVSDGISHYPKLPRTLVNHLEMDPSHRQGWESCRGSLRRWGDAVLYGPIRGIWVSTPFSEIAAHILIFPPRWPGKSTVALWPMTFRPRLLLLVRLKPASSTYMKLWDGSLDSNSIICCIPKQTKLVSWITSIFILDNIQLPQIYTYCICFFSSTAIGNVYRSCLLYYISL